MHVHPAPFGTPQSQPLRRHLGGKTATSDNSSHCSQPCSFLDFLVSHKVTRFKNLSHLSWPGFLWTPDRPASAVLLWTLWALTFHSLHLLSPDHDLFPSLVVLKKDLSDFLTFMSRDKGSKRSSFTFRMDLRFWPVEWHLYQNIPFGNVRVAF